MKTKPYLVVEWNDTETNATGWLCMYNFVSNYCGGGTRMHPTVTREEVIRLAEAMAYKYKACESVTTGGCKAGIAYDYKAPDAKDVLKRFLIAMAPYLKAGVSIGGDLGVDYGDVLNILDEIGVGLPQTKAMKNSPEIQQGIINHDDACDMSYDGFKMYDMITGYGCSFAADELWQLRGGNPDATVVIQGFGCVGASAAYCLDKMGYKVIGIADANRYVYCVDGLDVKKLVATKLPKGELNPDAFAPNYLDLPNSAWLDYECDILMPAALEDVIHQDNVNNVKTKVIIEAANIPVTTTADQVLHEKGIDVGVDFVVNMGGIRIYEALIFRICGPVPQDIVNDTEQIIRKNTRKVYNAAKETGQFARDVAMEMFVPDLSDTPDI